MTLAGWMALATFVIVLVFFGSVGWFYTYVVTNGWGWQATVILIVFGLAGAAAWMVHDEVKRKAH